MTDFQKDIISIVKAALTGEKCSLSQDFNYKKAYDFAVKQQIVCLIFTGLSLDKEFQRHEIYPQFFILVCNHLSVSVNQCNEIDKLSEAFKNSNIDFIPLKGAVMKHLYPKPELRSMGDADILINIEQNEEITSILNGFGYQKENDFEHEINWQKPGILHLELHRELIPPSSDDLFFYYKNPWKRAVLNEQNMYEFSPEDTLIYLLVHFVKHFRSAGAGIRNIVDLYLFAEKYPKMNKKYIKAELEKLNLYEFYLNLQDVTQCWFYDKSESEVINQITDMAFGGGIYGSKEKLEEAKKSYYSSRYRFGKLRKLINFTFKPKKQLESKYRFLKKAPVLLPVAWVMHWFEVLFKRTKSIKTVADYIGDISYGENSHNKQLKIIGLQIFFEKNINADD